MVHSSPHTNSFYTPVFQLNSEMIVQHSLMTEPNREHLLNGPSKAIAQDTPLENKRAIPQSPKSLHTTKDSQESTSGGLSLSISSQSSVSSTHSKLDAGSPTCAVNNELSQSYVAELVKEANDLLDSSDHLGNERMTSLLKNLTTALIKAKSQTNHYKMKAEWLSISSKDADARYEVENEIIKREVDRLKNQGDSVEYLMGKITHQKQTLKKYKNEIINKNKEIISKNRQLNKLKLKIDSMKSETTNKRRKKTLPSPTNNPNMLDTLGLLASQVLTEEEKYDKSLTNSFPR